MEFLKVFLIMFLLLAVLFLGVYAGGVSTRVEDNINFIQNQNQFIDSEIKELALENDLMCKNIDFVLNTAKEVDSVPGRHPFIPLELIPFKMFRNGKYSHSLFLPPKKIEIEQLSEGEKTALFRMNYNNTIYFIYFDAGKNRIVELKAVNELLKEK